MTADNEQQQVMNKRDALRKRLSDRYPDKDFSDDEVLAGQVSDDYDQYDKDLSGYKEREEGFKNMFLSDPRSAAFVTAWRKGEDPVIALIRQFGDEFKDALDNPELTDKLAAANKEYVDRVAANKKLEEEYNKNIDQTLADLQKIQEEEGLSDSDVDDVMELLESISHDGIVGKFTPESIRMAIKAIKHDDDVADAQEEGEVMGKNAKIEEKLKKRAKGDGLPQLNGKNNSPKTAARPKSIFDIAAGAE